MNTKKTSSKLYFVHFLDNVADLQRETISPTTSISFAADKNLLSAFEKVSIPTRIRIIEQTVFKQRMPCITDSRLIAFSTKSFLKNIPSEILQANKGHLEFLISLATDLTDPKKDIMAVAQIQN